MTGHMTGHMTRAGQRSAAAVEEEGGRVRVTRQSDFVQRASYQKCRPLRARAPAAAEEE